MRRVLLGLALGIAAVGLGSHWTTSSSLDLRLNVTSKDVQALEQLLGASGRPALRVSRAGFQLAADEGCTDALPYACNGANVCCDSPSIYYCENYQGPLKAMRGRSGCVKAGASDEAIKDFSQSCARFTAC